MPTCPKVAPKLAHRSRVVAAMTRKKTAQAPSVLGTTTVLSALIMNERFWLVAMIAGMRIVAHNSTELTRLTGTSTRSQLFNLLLICIAAGQPYTADLPSLHLVFACTIVPAQARSHVS